MKVRNILAALLLLVAGMQTALAQKVVLHKTNGETIEYDVSELDSIVFKDKVEFPISMTCPDSNHPHAIDFGLPSGTKWCCCNVGAEMPESVGGYFAWGETDEKSEYDDVSYIFLNGQDTDGDGRIDQDGSYIDIGIDDIAGTDYDVAYVRMGDSWCMPSKAQQDELRDNCSIRGIQQNGVNGILVTGPNGGRIFMPSTGYYWKDHFYDDGGYGGYWSSSRIHTELINVFSLVFNTINGYSNWDWDASRCSYGRPVRPVRVQNTQPEIVKRVVLLEDFTGQRCTNCPKATEVIEQLQEMYGDALVSVAIHGGPLGFAGNANFTGLATETGNEYYNHWNLEYQPIGLVNRQTPVNYPEWAAAVRMELAKIASLRLEGTAVLSKGTVTINIDAEGTDETFIGKLQVWLIEDNIKALQLMPDGTANQEYIHNHVFRTAVNGTWGEDFSIEKGKTVQRTMTLPLDQNWNPNELSIVAFVYNDNGVQQATKLKVE